MKFNNIKKFLTVINLLGIAACFNKNIETFDKAKVKGQYGLKNRMGVYNRNMLRHAIANSDIFTFKSILNEYHAVIKDYPIMAKVLQSGRSGNWRQFSIDALRYLRDKGANPNAQYRGHTPLYYATVTKTVTGVGFHDINLELMDILIGAGADVNLINSSREGHTPLIKAITQWQENSKNYVNLLTNRGANVNFAASGGSKWTPLHWAATNPLCFEEVRLLLEHGANANARDNDQSTPLHNAAFYGSYEIAKLLVERGAEINVRNSAGFTPLHDANPYSSIKVRGSDHESVARFLLHHGGVQ